MIYSAIRRDMEDVDDEKKGMGNSGRGKDISTIIDAEQEDEEEDVDEDIDTKKPKPSGKQMGDDSEDSDEIKRPKKTKAKKRQRKLNNLEVSSEDDARDEDFKIKESTSDSDEAYSMSSVSESSLEYARGRKKNDRMSTRTRRKRFEPRFINDNDTSDDEPLVKSVKRKKNKSDSDEYDLDDEDSDGESNENEDIDSEDLCDDSETESSEGNWPKKKKRAPASYDKRPAKKKVKRTEDEDKAFRAGISTKKLLKEQVEKAEVNKDSESESEDETKRRKTRGKKLLYLMEDDLESSDDGIKPGVKRPDTPPEEREMFIKKQEEIKRMIAAKNAETAKQFAGPNIEPIQIMLNKPPPPPVLPGGPISDSLSTIPKQVIESARALDTDYLRKAPISAGMELPDDFNPEDMNEEELAKMMEEEDFAQHQLKLAGEAIARTKKIKELEGKKDGAEKPKRGRKSKAEKALEAIASQASPGAPTTIVAPSVIPPVSMPQHAADIQMSRPSAIASLQTFTNHPQHPPSKLIQQLQTTLSAPPTSMMPLGAIPNQPPPQLLQHHHHMRPSMPHQVPNMMPGMYGPGMFSRPPHMGQPPMERRGPSIFHDAQQQAAMLPTTLLNVHPSQMHLQPPIPQQEPQQESPESKKRGRRKKFTPLRTDLPNDPNEQPPAKSAEFGSPNSSSSGPSSTPDRNDPKVSGN